MPSRTPEEWWDQHPPEEQPGHKGDPSHGLGGEAEPLPTDDADRDEDMS